MSGMANTSIAIIVLIGLKGLINTFPAIWFVFILHKPPLRSFVLTQPSQSILYYKVKTVVQYSPLFHYLFYLFLLMFVKISLC